MTEYKHLLLLSKGSFKRVGSLEVQWLELPNCAAKVWIQSSHIVQPKKKKDRKKITASLENMEKASPDQKF